MEGGEGRGEEARIGMAGAQAGKVSSPSLRLSPRESVRREREQDLRWRLDRLFKRPCGLGSPHVWQAFDLAEGFSRA